MNKVKESGYTGVYGNADEDEPSENETPKAESTGQNLEASITRKIAEKKRHRFPPSDKAEDDNEDYYDEEDPKDPDEDELRAKMMPPATRGESQEAGEVTSLEELADLEHTDIEESEFPLGWETLTEKQKQSWFSRIKSGIRTAAAKGWSAVKNRVRGAVHQGMKAAKTYGKSAKSQMIGKVFRNKIANKIRANRAAKRAGRPSPGHVRDSFPVHEQTQPDMVQTILSNFPIDWVREENGRHYISLRDRFAYGMNRAQYDEICLEDMAQDELERLLNLVPQDGSEKMGGPVKGPEEPMENPVPAKVEGRSFLERILKSSIALDEGCKGKKKKAKKESDETEPGIDVAGLAEEMGVDEEVAQEVADALDELKAAADAAAEENDEPFVVVYDSEMESAAVVSKLDYEAASDEMEGLEVLYDTEETGGESEEEPSEE